MSEGGSNSGETPVDVVETTKEEEVSKTEEETVKTKEEAVKTKDEIVKTKDEIVKTEDEAAQTEEEVVKTEEEVVKTEEEAAQTEEEIVKTEEVVEGKEEEEIVKTEEVGAKEEEEEVVEEVVEKEEDAEQEETIKEENTTNKNEISTDIVASKEKEEMIDYFSATPPSLGILRLDHDYPPALGDINNAETFTYNVYYRVVPGLTFEMCKSGKLSKDVQEKLFEAVDYLEKEKDVSGITADCGFMMFFQSLVRSRTKKPVFLSPLTQLPAVTSAYSENEKIIIMTSNGKSLEPMRDLIRKECGVDTQQERCIIVGCEDVDGFEAVGEKVDVAKCTPGIIQKAMDILQEHPTARAIVLESTELPPFADALRFYTRIPVYDAITNANFFMTGLQDNERFGMNNMEKWDGKQKENYTFGQNLAEDEKENPTEEDTGKLANKSRVVPIEVEDEDDVWC